VYAMRTIAASSFSERLDRFLRWFFSASPDPVAPAPPRRLSRTVARRQPSRLLPKHSGPVRVAGRAKR
jgi:hypothetical protein